MQQGDPTRNALLELVQQLNRIDKLPDPVVTPEFHNDAQLPRVVKPTAPVTLNLPHLIPDDESVPQEEPRAPRVGSNYAPVTALLEPSSLPKNARFMNSNPHQYNLRSKVHTIPDDQVA